MCGVMSAMIDGGERRLHRLRLQMCPRRLDRMASAQRLRVMRMWTRRTPLERVLSLPDALASRRSRPARRPIACEEIAIALSPRSPRRPVLNAPQRERQRRGPAQPVGQAHRPAGADPVLRAPQVAEVRSGIVVA